MSHFIVILSLLLPAFSASSAWATYDNPTCDSVCGQIVDTSTDKILNTSGTDGWSAPDTAWCSANPTNNVTGGTTGTTVASLSANATTATDQNRCQYHDSQVLNYCLAYEATTSTDKFNIPLLALDVGAAATCGIECFNPISSTIGAACHITSTAASAAQILDEMSQSSSGVSKDIGEILGAAGIANNVVGVMTTTGGLSHISNIVEFMKDQPANTASASQANKLNACISMGVMSAMAAMRVAQLASHAASKQSSCQSVLNLLSSQPVITASTGTATGEGGSTAGASGATSGGSIIGSGAASASNIASTAACAQNGIGSCPDSGQMSAATDGGLMSSTGLDQTAGTALAAQDLPALANAINSGQSAGSMIGSAMQGQGVDGAIDTIKGITDDMQKNLVSVAASPAYSSSGAGGAVKPAQSAFGKGFDFGSSAAGATPAGELKFNRAPSAIADGDIWHEGYKGSIFQIVSTKIVETKDRINSMDWSTPLNRALMGLPAQKKESAK
jgi:hypothetical protein